MYHQLKYIIKYFVLLMTSCKGFQFNYNNRKFKINYNTRICIINLFFFCTNNLKFYKLSTFFKFYNALMKLTYYICLWPYCKILLGVSIVLSVGAYTAGCSMTSRNSWLLKLCALTPS